jgi:hypothetical protein
VAGSIPSRMIHAIGVLSSDDTLIERVHLRNISGDCLFVRHFDEQKGDWSEGVTFRDSSCRLNGRTGLTLTGATRVRIVNNVFDQINFTFVNIEPGEPHEGASDLVIRDNTIKSYGLSAIDDPWFFASCDASWNYGDSTVRDVTITGNTIEGNRTGWGPRNMKSLHIRVCGNTGPRENFTVTNNTGIASVEGPSMYFTDVRGVTVTGNKQPLSSGGLASFPGSTGVTYDG